MPLYRFINKKTGQITSELFTFEEKLEHLEIYPELRSVIEAPAVVSDRVVSYKNKNINGDLRYQLKKISKDYPGNTVNVR